MTAYRESWSARVVLVLVLAVLALGDAPYARLSQAQTPPIRRTVRQRADVPGTNLEVVYASVEIAAGAKAGRHSHPGVAMAEIVEGDFWFQLDGQPERILHPGDTVSVPVNAVHNEGALDKPVKLNAVYVVEKGKPLASPAQ